MPRPETTMAAPVLVVTAARWISPRSTVARTLPGAFSACGTSIQTCNSKPRFQTRVQAPLFSGRSRCSTSEACPLPIGQHHAPLLNAHRLRWPVDGVEALRPPGVFHSHLGMCGTQFAGGFDVGEK